MDDILVAAQLGQSHGATGVEFLGGNAHFAPKAEFTAIRKAGGTVHIHGGAVHCGSEQVGMGLCLGQDGLAVAGGVLSNMPDGLLHAVHDLDREDVVQKFGVKVLFSGRGAGDDGGCALIQPQLHRV